MTDNSYIKFIQNYEDPFGNLAPRKVEIEIAAHATLPEVLETVLDFIRAAGYSVPTDAYLEIKEESNE